MAFPSILLVPSLVVASLVVTAAPDPADPQVPAANQEASSAPSTASAAQVEVITAPTVQVRGRATQATAATAGSRDEAAGPMTITVRCEAWALTGATAGAVGAILEESPGAAAEARHAVLAAGSGAARELKVTVPMTSGTPFQYRGTADTPTVTVSQGSRSTQTSFSGYQSAGTSLELRSTAIGDVISTDFQIELSGFQDGDPSMPPPRTTTRIEGSSSAPSGTLRVFQFAVGETTMLVFLHTSLP